MGISAGKQKLTITENNHQRKGKRRCLLIGRKKAPPSKTATLQDSQKEGEEGASQWSDPFEKLNGSLEGGYVPEDMPSTTVTLQDSTIKELYDLPMEILDVILQKSYLHWILNTSAKQRDEDVIRSLISVDVCFNQSITRQQFKKAIWRYLKSEIYSKYYSQTY